LTSPAEPNAPPALPADALLFKFPRDIAWIMFGGSLFCFGFVAFAVTWRLTDPAQASLAVVLPCAVVFGALGAWCLRSFGRLRDSVAVNSEGIWYLPRKGEPTFIAWGDVATVSAQDTQQRLVLRDETSRRCIRLEYQLKDFGQLRDFVLHHTEATRLHAPATGVFHRTWINKGILLGATVAFLSFAWLSLHQGQPVPSLFFVGFAGLFLVALARDPTRVVITREGVVIKYLGWKRTIPFDAISAITLTDVQDRGNVWAAVIIERRQSGPLKLFRFREGSIALRDALDSTWRSAGKGD
jgi:hypothetical protein